MIYLGFSRFYLFYMFILYNVLRLYCSYCYYVSMQAMVDGMSLDTIYEYTKIDPWFLSQFAELHAAEQWLKTQTLDSISYDDLLATKQRGFSDVQIARAMGVSQALLLVSSLLPFVFAKHTTQARWPC